MSMRFNRTSTLCRMLVAMYATSSTLPHTKPPLHFSCPFIDLLLLSMLLPHALTQCCKGKGDAVVWSLMPAGSSAQCERRVVVIRQRRMAEEEDERSSIAARPSTLSTRRTLSNVRASCDRRTFSCHACALLFQSNTLSIATASEA